MKNADIIKLIYSRIRAAISYRFDLKGDQHGFDDIDQSIRDGVEIKGTNLWVLMLAIFVASIGLNVNSTAVIIGAMLISPLMGPIMGVGYGAGINDYQLIKKALGNLLVSILISLFTSTIYFALSPLSVAQSELLARTTPTIWDVLIALFGGLAGIIALTRKEKSNVIPGVAIATALMPPLCTAGFGLANGSMEMFFGAFYLFFINGVFIALATLLLTGYLNPPHKHLVSEELERKVKRYIYTVVLLTVLPSIYLAYGLVRSEVFNSRANEFIKHELILENGFIAKQELDANQALIEITLVGQKVSDDRITELTQKLAQYHLESAKLKIQQTVIKELDEASLKKSLLADMLNSNQETFASKNKQIEDLKSELARLSVQQGLQIEFQKEQQKIYAELIAQYPQIKKVSIARTVEYQAGSEATSPVLLIIIEYKNKFSGDDKRRVLAWLKIRTGVEKIKFSSNRN